MRKLDYRNLEALPEWQVLKARLIKTSIDFQEEMILAAENGKVEIVMNRAGKVAAIAMFLGLPKELMPATEGE